MPIIFYSPRSVCLSKRPSRHRWSLGVYAILYDGLMLEKGWKWPQLKSSYCMCTCIERFVENWQCFQFPSACHWPRNTLQHITKVLLAEDVEPGVRLSRDVFESLACMLCDRLSLSCFLDFCTKICRTISQCVRILCKLASAVWRHCLNVFDDTRPGRDVNKRVTAEEVRVQESLYGFSSLDLKSSLTWRSWM